MSSLLPAVSPLLCPNRPIAGEFAEANKFYTRLRLLAPSDPRPLFRAAFDKLSGLRDRSGRLIFAEPTPPAPRAMGYREAFQKLLFKGNVVRQLGC